MKRVRSKEAHVNAVSANNSSPQNGLKSAFKERPIPTPSTPTTPRRKRERSLQFRLVLLIWGAVALAYTVQQCINSSWANRVMQGTCRLLQQQQVAGKQPKLASALFNALANATLHKPQVHKRVVNPAMGIYPKWRDVQYSGKKSRFWDVVEYEYYDEKRRKWTTTQPASCRVEGERKPAGYQWFESNPRTEATCKETHCIYRNLWYNNGRFYLLVDGPNEIAGWPMTRNQELNVLHVKNAHDFVQSIDYKIVRGDTLVLDFVYFLHPTAIGHWCEVMFPLFSILKQERQFARPAAQFMLLHLKRVHLMEWVRAVIATTLGVPPEGDLPPLIMQREVDSVWAQIPQPLEGYQPHEWVSFERALVVRDQFTGGQRTFLNQQDAQEFRAEIYRAYQLPVPAPRPVPRVITFQRKRANRRIINEEQFLKLLREFGEVRVVEFNSSSSFKEQLETMSSTGVYISVHTSNLANAPFLQPGSAVVELLQKNWIWDNLDRSFKVQTDSMGDLHHFAWRARFRNQTLYINKRDAERFAAWPSLLCDTEECVEAHTNVDVVVNLRELKALLQDRLPLVYAGVPVAEAALPWPAVE